MLETPNAFSSTLAGRLALLARDRGDSVALREKRRGVWKEISWAKYFDEVSATARAFVDAGVEVGDHVAILSDNRPEWLYADLGAQSIGARSVGIYQTNPAADVAYIIRHSEAKLLVCEDQEQVDKALEIIDDSPSLRRVVVIDPRGTTDYGDERLTTWEDLVAGGREALANERNWMQERIGALDPDAPSMVVYTSGTTGNPKGALLAPRNVVDISAVVAPYLDFSERDLTLSYLPLCHVAEKIFSLFVPLTVGCVVHFGESIDTIRQDLVEVSPTIFLGVPRIWEKMHANVLLKMRDSSWLKRTLFGYFTEKGQALAQRRDDWSILDRLTWKLGDLLVFRPLQERLGLRRCRRPVTGAAPISAELIRWFHGIGVDILEGYGQTECGGVSHMNPPGRARLGTVGAPLPTVEAKLAEDGEILIRGDTVFVGYLHDEEATARTIDEDGWLHTGDIGELDDNGFLRITGRKKEIIITAGGKNLSPEKIENALKMSPFIKEAVALGDGQKFIAALIQIDYDIVGAWASRKDLAYTSFADLAGKEDVRRLIGDAIAETNEKHLARVENVREFRLFDKELNQDDGEVTATQKVRRKAIAEIYVELIASIYGAG